MGTNCAPLVDDLLLFFYERDFIMSLSADKDAEIIEAFNSTSRHLDDLLNIDRIVKQIYPSELQFNKSHSYDTGAPLPDLHLTISGVFFFQNLW